MSFVKKVASASFWLSIASWISSGISILTMLIFARILSVEEFGLIATATLITAFFELFSRLGTEAYLIKEEKLDKDDINTAWTIQLVAKLFIAFAIFLSAPLIAHYFNEPKLVLILKVLAIIPFIMAFANIGIGLLKKELAYKKLMLFDVNAKITSFALTLVALYFSTSFWVYIFGMVIYFVIITLSSYYFSPYRPTLCLKKLKLQFAFSQWSLLKGFVNFFNTKCDQLIVSKFVGTAALGAFSIAQRIYETASDVLITPFITVLFPGLGQLDKTSPTFSLIYHRTLIVTSLVIFLLAGLLAINAEALVEVALGDAQKWQLVTYLLPIAAPLLITRILSFALFDVFTLLNQMKFLFKFELITAIVSIVVLYLAVTLGDITTLVIARLVLTTLVCALLLLILQQHISFSAITFMLELLPIFTAAIVAFALCWPLQTIFLSHSPALLSIIIVSIGYCIVYIATILLMTALLKGRSDTYGFISEQLDNGKQLAKQKLFKPNVNHS
ncbi:hypothetical protein A3K86_20635 [Photobacterium jeanii]|uniref:Polysaccharide biosynthesis protein C-terminal domain-containing protein n=1 Tax=Photobacterium jeanii TaxID=858640 RepID=A0A178K216_9GAMM|nr:oligosaccharide flippase family protein [Photobacterium jeanii]OAN11358.1 hypothetical protein A3K86_20635 [Photobacterium jeanii]PST90878.1 hypothetical protein C9I91_09740 [Photobacterium jeanii]